MLDNIMLDIETLGDRPGSVILTIGACAFDIRTGEIGKEFYVNVTRESCEAYGLTVNERTLKWWSEQSEEAQAALYSEDALSLPDALNAFTRFCIDVRKELPNGKMFMWGNDTAFDLVLMECAYRACDKVEPWQFWEHRSVRTLVHLGKEEANYNPKYDLPREGVHHDALDDAKHQARYCSAIYQKLFGNKEAA